MSDFDGFYGIDNFSGSSNTQILVVQQEEIICSSVEIDIVQQKLAILVEVAKRYVLVQGVYAYLTFVGHRIIIEQICEVEVQTIVIEQFESIISSFGMDVGRQSGRQVAYDSNISGMYNQIINSDGSLSNSSHGFVGSDIGNSSFVSTGNNWNNVTSPQSVAQAKALAKTARNSVRRTSLCHSTDYNTDLCTWQTAA